jgi:hypothetical protein
MSAVFSMRLCVGQAYQDGTQARRVQCVQNVRDIRSCSRRMSRTCRRGQCYPAWGRSNPFHVAFGAARPSSQGTRCGKHSCFSSLPERRDRTESPAPSSTAPPSKGSQVRSTWLRWVSGCYAACATSIIQAIALLSETRYGKSHACTLLFLTVPVCRVWRAALPLLPVHPFDTAQSA